jgi:hypothetical protein
VGVLILIILQTFDIALWITMINANRFSVNEKKISEMIWHLLDASIASKECQNQRTKQISAKYKCSIVKNKR